LEGYNGWGYRNHHPAVKSPYLWSGSNHYRAGKYVADGTWSDTAVSSQCGAATLLRRLAERGELVAVSQVAGNKPKLKRDKKSALFKYSPDSVATGGIELQAFLNRLPDVFLKADGKLGPKTSAACKLAFGHYLSGDPRARRP
jgi:hypothetical protein